MGIDQLCDAFVRAVTCLADLPAEPGALECADAVRAHRRAHEIENEYLAAHAPPQAGTRLRPPFRG